MNDMPEFNEDDFFEDEQSAPTMDDTGLAQFQNMCNKVFEMDTEIKSKEAAIKEEKKVLEDLKGKVQFLMEKYKMQNTTCEGGMIYRTERTSVALPQDEDKKKFFAYLKEQGIFEDMVHMNSLTFNKFYKETRDAELEKGNVSWKMPGVGEEMVISKIGMRRGKAK